MSAIIEPESASWRVAGDAFLLEVMGAGDVVIRSKAGGTVALDLDELADLEAGLLNARLWLTRAIKQRDELAAAAEVGRDLAPEGRPLTPFELIAKLGVRSPS